MFAHPTATALAASVAETEGDEGTGGAIDAALSRVVADGPIGIRTHPDDSGTAISVPLSVEQRRIWFADRLLRGQSATAVYAVPVVIPLDDAVTDTAVTAAVVAVIDRHAPLRTHYPVSEATGEPYQRVLRSWRPDILPVDLGAQPLADALLAPPPHLRIHLGAPFDITAAPPVRVAIVRSAVGAFLVMVAHHAALDGQSVQVLTADLHLALAGRWLPPLDVTYPQWALAEQSVPMSVRAADRARLVATLHGYPGVLEIPTDRPRVAERSLRTSTVSSDFPTDIVTDIDGVCAATGLTRFAVIHAALALVLGQWASTDDVAVGTPVSLRRHGETADMVGMFVSTAVLRTRIGPGMGLRDALDHVRSVTTAALEDTVIGFDDLVAAVNPPRGAGRHPLVQVLLSLVDAAGPLLPAGIGDVLGDGSLSADSEFDLQVTFSVTDAGLVATVTYATALFDRDTAADLLARWRRAVTQIAAAFDPARTAGPGTVDAIDVRSDREIARHAALAAPLPPGEPVTLAGVLDRAVRAHAGSIALDDGTTRLTYAETEEWADAVAEALYAQGVRPGDVVAVRLVRSIESVVAMWGVARLGAVYAPIDPRYPAARIERMLAIADARAQIVPAGTAGDDRLIPMVPRPSTPRAVGRPQPVLVDAPAYIVFTSGSTGRPKAVEMTHRGLSLYADPALLGIEAGDRVAHAATPSFDIALMESLFAASAGATLAVIDADTVSGDAMTTALADAGVTVAFITPAVLVTLDPDRLDALRILWVGGDLVRPDLARRWTTTRRGEPRWFEIVYGPTETTILATRWAPPSPTPEETFIGETFPTMGSIVLDSHLRPVPDGCIGELYLLGPALAQGYRDAALSAVRFVATPPGVGSPGERMYRTGDRVRRTPGGLAFEGRADNQRQIRGLRVEPGEVSAALTDAGAAQAVTTVIAGPAGDVLVSYVVPGENPVDLRAAAARVLPAHMVPAQVIEIDRIPLTVVGKIDVAALPVPQWDTVRGGEPQTPTEAAVLEVFRATLGHPSIGVADDYFAVGGTSLQLARITAALRERLDVSVPITAVFTHPTPAELAALIDGGLIETGMVDGGPTGLFPAEVAAQLVHVVDLGDVGESSATPLWLVHPASGLASMYRPLAEQVGGPVFGLQLPDLLDNAQTSPSTIGALAAEHLAAVRTRQPHGPYRFGGWSLGGQIAHAMAHQVVDAGETVELLVLVDGRTGVDVSAAGEGAITIDPDIADALRTVDAARFDAYARRITDIAASAAAFVPAPTAITHTVLVVASDTTDIAVDRWRPALTGRVTRHDIDAVHADLGEPATMRAIGDMLTGTDHTTETRGPR